MASVPQKATQFQILSLLFLKTQVVLTIATCRALRNVLCTVKAFWSFSLQFLLFSREYTVYIKSERELQNLEYLITLSCLQLCLKNAGHYRIGSELHIMAVLFCSTLFYTDGVLVLHSTKALSTVVKFYNQYLITSGHLYLEVRYNNS